MTVIRTGSSPSYWSKLPKSEWLKGRQVTVDQSIYLIRNETKINMRRGNLLVMSKTNKSGDNLRASKAKWYFFFFLHFLVPWCILWWYFLSYLYMILKLFAGILHCPEFQGSLCFTTPSYQSMLMNAISEKWGICYKQSVRKRNLKDTPYKRWTDLSTM